MLHRGATTSSPRPALRSASVSPQAGQTGRSLTCQLGITNGADQRAWAAQSTDLTARFGAAGDGLGCGADQQGIDKVREIDDPAESQKIIVCCCNVRV